MLSRTGLRQRLKNLGRIAAEVFDDPTPVEPPTAQALPAESPLEHLRRAIAATRSRDVTSPNPKVYRELRLLLNQLESGRVSSEPTREISRVQTPTPVLETRPRLRTLLRRKAQAAVMRVATRRG